MGLGVFVSEMGRKQQGLWEEEEGKPEVYSANVFYNNTSEIAKVWGQGQRQSGEGLGPPLHVVLTASGTQPPPFPILPLNVNFFFGGRFPTICSP